MPLYNVLKSSVLKKCSPVEVIKPQIWLHLLTDLYALLHLGEFCSVTDVNA